MLVVPATRGLLAITDAIAAAGPFQHCTVKLFTNNTTPIPASNLAQFTEAAFPGYVGSTSITWGPPFIDTDGLPTVIGDAHQFQMSDNTTPTVVYGWYSAGTGADSVNLIGAELFTGPIPLNTTQDLVVVLPKLKQSQSGDAYITGI